TGVRPSIFRAPYGIRWFGRFSVLRERDMPLIHWSNVGFDWRGSKSASDITRLALEGLGPGSIILLHDGFGTRPADQFDRSRTVAALPAIIEGARKAGLK